MPEQRTYLYVGCCTRPTPYYPTHNGKGIAAFSFEPGAFRGSYGQRAFQFAPVGLELKLTDGGVQTVRPFQGWK